MKPNIVTLKKVLLEFKKNCLKLVFKKSDYKKISLHKTNLLATIKFEQK